MTQDKNLLPNVLVFSRFGARHVFTALLLGYFLGFNKTAVGAPLPPMGVAVFFVLYSSYVFLLSRLTVNWDGLRIARWTLAGELPLIVVSLMHDPLSNLPLLMMIPLIQIEYGLRNTRQTYVVAAIATTIAVALGLALRTWAVGPIGYEVWVMMLPMAFMGYYTWKVMQQRQFISDQVAVEKNTAELATAAAGLAIWSIDVKAKRLIWDETAHQQAGVKVGEFKGTYKEFFSQMSKEDAKRVEKAFADAIRDRSEVDVDYDILWPDKSLHSIRCRGQIQLDEHGEVASILGVSIDETRLRQSTATVQRSVERLEQAQELTGAGIWSYDVATRRVTWDDQVHRIFGVPKGQFDGTLEHFTRLVHPDDRERVGQAIDRALNQNQPYAVEFHIQTPDGTERVVNSAAKVRYHERGKQTLSLLGAVVDVSAHRKDQERLHAMSQRALSVGDALRVGSWRYWPGRGHLDVDKSFRQLVGLNSREPITGLDPILQRLVPEDREGFIRTIQETLAAGGEFSWFWRLHDDKGALREFQWLGHVLPGFDGSEDELVACVMDVTRLVQTRKSLETQVRAERESATEKAVKA